MGDEIEKEGEAKKATGVVGVLVWLGMILAVYVLSIGPVIRMYDKRVIPNTTKWDTFLWNGFYAPLGWAYDKTALHKPLGMYLHLWSDIFDSKGEVQR